MILAVKICGLREKEHVHAAIDHGADFIGFVFFAKSPRYISPMQAAPLIDDAGPSITKVGLIVDEEDDFIEEMLRHCSLNMLQLHGRETPARVAAIREKFGLPIIKALPIDTLDDLDIADSYAGLVDWLLFDAKPAPQDTRPGGNARSFDWSILKKARDSALASPWMLAGGLNAMNIEAAVKESGAMAVDVSSGVEITPGCKDTTKIATFLKLAKQINS